jgi:hypothetical protein
MNKKPTTPRSRVKNGIRRIWLASRERAAAIKRANYTCAICQRHGSVAKGREVKIICHHTDGIDWDGVVDLIFERVLQTPEAYTVLCKECHEKLHREET